MLASPVWHSFGVEVNSRLEAPPCRARRATGALGVLIAIVSVGVLLFGVLLNVGMTMSCSTHCAYANAFLPLLFGVIAAQAFICFVVRWVQRRACRRRLCGVAWTLTLLYPLSVAALVFGAYRWWDALYQRSFRP